MTQIIMINSFRGGTGKSTITSNLASYLAQAGKKVIIIDTDIASPSIHNIFGLTEKNFSDTFSDYLFGRCEIEDAVYDISPTIKVEDNKLLLIPASTAMGTLAQTVSGKRSHNLLRKAIEELMEQYDPDYIMLDTHPGINEEVLLTATFANTVLTIVRPDRQDYQGIEISSKVIKKLGARMNILLNKVHKKLNGAQIKKQLENDYKIPVIGALPFDEEVLYAESRYIFSLKFPEHKFSQVIKRVAAKVFGIEPKEKYEVMHDLLHEIKSAKWIDNKKLLERTKISKSVFKENLDWLVNQKFLLYKEGNSSITERGEKFLDNFKSISKFIVDFGL